MDSITAAIKETILCINFNPFFYYRLIYIRNNDILF